MQDEEAEAALIMPRLLIRRGSSSSRRSYVGTTGHGTGESTFLESSNEHGACVGFSFERQREFLTHRFFFFNNPEKLWLRSLLFLI